MNLNYGKIFSENFDLFFKEDEISKNFLYLTHLPQKTVSCSLKIKDDLILVGLPFFFETFNYLGASIDYSQFMEFEGKSFEKNSKATIEFELPFNIALTGERIALNLLQRASSVASYTSKYVAQADFVRILDTRKTTPGLRFLEKYAVNLGGGHNHRFGQTDAWMIKDNHKAFFGGVKEAIDYFRNIKTFYTPLIVEIHELSEILEAYEFGAKHFLLDNFSPNDIEKAVSIKKEDMTFEVSGGITLQNLSGYIINGVDAISTGAVIYNAPQVDLSLKFNS